MGRSKNPNIRSEEDKIEYTEEMIKEFIRCSEDIIYFCEKYCYIISIDKGRELVSLREYQKRILKSFCDKSDPERKNNIILSGRQSGKTLTTALYCLHFALFNKDKNVAILANAEKTALEILGTLKMVYESLPLWLQQPVKEDGWSASKVSLGNGCKIFASSTASNAARGFTISCVSGDTLITIRNKETGLIEKVSMDALRSRLLESKDEFKLV